MAAAWESLVQGYNYIIYDLAHPSTKNLFLVTSPFPLIVILIAYNLFCIKIGPFLMKNRKPYDLKTTIKFYNILQILSCLYTSYEGTNHLLFSNFNFYCQPVELNNPRVVAGSYVYFITKIIDLLDTIFFVFRKSYRQISFLHLYHHTLMVILSWFAMKYYPGGQCLIIGTINSVVHVVMYTYYFISGLGPKYKKYLWWKNYITIMQIVQFVIILIHSVNSLFYPCEYPTTLKIMSIIESCIFIYLFSNFYYHTYIKTKSSDGPSNSIDKQNGHLTNHGSSVHGKHFDNNKKSE